jgi:hypothetical protein
MSPVPWQRNAFRALPLVLLVAAGLWQTARVGQDFGNRLTGKIWANRGLDAVSRSADVAYGEDYRRYVEFLRAQIPEEASVVVLRTSGLPQFQSRSFLQYFLLPRRVVVCTEDLLEECILRWHGPDAFFIYKGVLPAMADIGVPLDRVELREGEGILAPMDGLTP